MNIFEYIDKYGKYSFEEKEFNEVDNAILAVLSYLDLSGIVSNSNKIKRTIKEVASVYFDMYSLNDSSLDMIMDIIEIFKCIQNKRRYQDILMYGYCYIGDHEQQFSAVCLEISDDTVYVSFEGTDHLVSGWEEDFRMTYQFPVLSQKRAISYVNKHFLFSSKKLIFGGHSKGGNLALVAAMYCNFWVRRKIINVYNNDGPGLRKKQFESRCYQRISDRLIHIIPNYSIVGLLLRHSDNYRVIKSSKRGILSHAIVTWEVYENSFKLTKLSSFSKAVDKGALAWLEQYDDVTREKIFTALFDIFRKAEVHTLVEIMDNEKLILKLLRESSNLDPKIRDMIMDFFPVLFKYYGQYQIDKIKSLF